MLSDDEYTHGVDVQSIEDDDRDDDHMSEDSLYSIEHCNLKISKAVHTFKFNSSNNFMSSKSTREFHSYQFSLIRTLVGSIGHSVKCLQDSVCVTSENAAHSSTKPIPEPSPLKHIPLLIAEPVPHDLENDNNPEILSSDGDADDENEETE